MRIVIISDTHGRDLNIWDIPDGDVLLHCGDFCCGRGWRDIELFREQMMRLPHPHKLVVGGNHDHIIEKDRRKTRELLGPVHYMEDEALVIGGLKFWGTPWQPEYMAMAFNMRRGSDELHEKRVLIPDDVDVLMTHCPPAEILDWLNFHGALGCNQLRWRVDNLPQLKLHCFGHIHEGYGVDERDGKTFVNAALVAGDENRPYPETKKPIVIDL